MLGHSCALHEFLMRESNDRNDPADPFQVADSGQGDSANAFMHNSKLRNKLEKLARRRIDPSLIEFTEDAREFRGGFATVLRGFLAPSPSAEEVGNESVDPADEHPDPDSHNPQSQSDTQERKDDEETEEESNSRTTDDDKDHDEEDRRKVSDTHEDQPHLPTSTPTVGDADEAESSERSAPGDPGTGDRNAVPQRDIGEHGDNHQDKDEGTDSRAVDGDNDQANEEGREGSDNHQEEKPQTLISTIGGEPAPSEHTVDKDPDRSTNPNPQLQNDTQEPRDNEQDRVGEAGNQLEDVGNYQTKNGQNFGRQTPQQKRIVAVKKLKIKGDMDFERVLGLALRESEFLVELSHPNIVKLEGFVEDLSTQKVWLIFPWEEHGNLRDFLAFGEWQIPERISLFYDVTLGLDYLHSREPPIYHGDLKSLNILVDSECNALITDFGSARHLLDDHVGKQPKESGPKPRPVADVTTNEEHITLEAFFSATASTLTLSGSSYTIRWAAPELLQDEKPCLRSDIWALGWIAYEVMTNTIPFHDVKKDAIVINRVIQGHLPAVTEDARMSLVRALCSLMVQCWSIDPDRRPSAEECYKAISWMPMIAPAATATINELASKIRHARLLNKLGNMYRRQSDYVSALSCFAEALDIYTDQNDSIGRAETLCNLAEVHRFRSEHPEAITLYLEALKIYTDHHDETERANALWGLATAYRLGQQYDEAFKLYSEVLQIFTDTGRKRQRATALWGLGEVHRFRFEYSQARNLFSEALPIFTDVGDRREKALTLWSLAEVHRVQREYNEAIDLLSEALQIYTEFGDRREKALTLQSIANVHQFQQNYLKAIPLYSEALQIISDVGDQREKAIILCGLARVHQFQDEEAKALTLYSEALQIFSEVGDRRETANTMWGLAQLHRSQQEYSPARKLYSESLQIYTDIGDGQSRGSALWGLAELHRDLHEYNEATELYSEAMQIFTDIGDRYWKAETLLGLAANNQERGHFGEAISLFTDASKVFGEMGESGRAFNALDSAAAIRRTLENTATDSGGTTDIGDDIPLKEA
ncbi:hypothetical protein FRC01_009993 [Tulasnella sp. 417]|nr:hypothetical protein FRC01_009993 [Tulasnella sp. 417]